MTWNPRRHRSDREILTNIESKVETLVTAIEDLTKAIEALESEESAAAAEFKLLVEEIGTLKAGTITEAQVESLATKASAVAAALKTATPEGPVA